MIIYLLYLWAYYGCFQYYVENAGDHPSLYWNITIIVSIIMTLMILQFMVTQICCIERLYAVFKKKDFALKVRHLFAPIFFMIFGVIVMISAVFAYFISHIDGYAHWNDYIKYIFPFGILFIIVSRIVMVYVLIQQISTFIVEAILKWTKIKENAQNQGNPKASVTRQTITPYNADDTLPSILIPKKSNTVLTSTPETLPNANIKTGSIDTLKTDDWMEQLLPKMERIFRTGLKLTTITIFADVIMIIPGILSILLVFLKMNNILSLSIGYVFITCSMLSILYGYLHYSFSNDIYYRRFICCVKCDDLFKKYMSKKITNNIKPNVITPDIKIGLLSAENASLNHLRNNTQ